jgi:hypothetical protein
LFCCLPFCELLMWKLSCMSKSAFLAGPLWTNPSMPRKVQGMNLNSNEWDSVR